MAMMRLSTVSLSCLILGIGSAHAEGLKINPYPEAAPANIQSPDEAVLKPVDMGEPAQAPLSQPISIEEAMGGEALSAHEEPDVIYTQDHSDMLPMPAADVIEPEVVNFQEPLSEPIPLPEAAQEIAVITQAPAKPKPAPVAAIMPEPEPIAVPEPVEPKIVLSENVYIPQPGDDYFNPPSQELLEAVQPEEQIVEMGKPTPAPTVPEYTIITSAPGVNDAQVEEDGDLQVSMGDDFADLEALSEAPVSSQKEEQVAWEQEAIEPAAGPFWDALAGADMHKILKRWSDEANVELIWDSDQSFEVRSTHTSRGPYELAVQGLLDQYMKNNVRPVATLHVDEMSGQKTLVIRDLKGA